MIHPYVFFRKCTPKQYAVFFLLLLFVANLLPGALGAEEGNAEFVAPRLKIFFQPGMRVVLPGSLPLRDEVGRLNLILNLFENYLDYLLKMDKIASSTRISLEYNPVGSTDAVIAGQRVLLTDLGLNTVLATINAVLARQSDTKESFLLTAGDDLTNIRDYLFRKSRTMESAVNFQNLSLSLPALAPDMDFALAGSGSISLRPWGNTNQMVFLPSEGSGSVLLPPQSKGYIANLRVSSNETYVAFTVGGFPMIMKLAGSVPQNLFSANNKVILDMEWSPLNNRLAGIVLNKETLERKVFVFDADKNRHFEKFGESADMSGDYLFPYPIWAPDGTKLLFSSGDEIHLLDLEPERAYPRVFVSTGTISEILWSPDSKSFACTEVFGQARDKHEFNDMDFRYSVLRRFRLTPLGLAVEDEAQRRISKNTLKLLQFWTKDRVLFLEGALKSQKVNSPLWDMEKIFHARLSPTSQLLDKGETAVGPTDIPLYYCFAFRNLDGKFKNIFDSGFSGMNHLFIENMITTWFIGVNIPEGIARESSTFSMRNSPYPFIERNRVLFSPLPQVRVKNALELLKSYELRRFEIGKDRKMLYFLSNSAGPLSLWRGNLETISEAKGLSDEAQESLEMLPGHASPPSVGIGGPEIIFPSVPTGSDSPAMTLPALPGEKNVPAWSLPPLPGK